MSNKKHWLGFAALATFCLPLAAVADAYSDKYTQIDTPGMQIVRQYTGRPVISRGGKYFNNNVPMIAPSSAPRTVQFAPMEVDGLSHAAASGADNYLHDVCKEGTFVWQPEKFPLKVYIEDGSGTPGYRPQFAQFAADAFNTWDKVTNHRLSWVQVNSPQGADITVRWTDSVTERVEGTEAGKTAAVTRLNPMTGMGTISGAKMQFLTRLPQRQFSDDEVKKTCLHEAGHALGLQGHSTNRNDIMYYAVSPTQGFLTSRDVSTMNRLYETYPAMPSTVTLGPKPRNN